MELLGASISSEIESSNNHTVEGGKDVVGRGGCGEGGEGVVREGRGW